MGTNSPKLFPSPMPFGASPTNQVSPDQPVAQVAQPQHPFTNLQNLNQINWQNSPTPQQPITATKPKNPFSGNPIFGPMVDRLNQSRGL